MRKKGKKPTSKKNSKKNRAAGIGATGDATASFSRKQTNKHYDNNGSTRRGKVDAALYAAVEADGSKSIVNMADDGNCLFRSISDQLYHDYGHEHHATVRNEVCNFLEAHEDDFRDFLIVDVEDAHDEDYTPDFDSYVSQMRNDGAWGGHLELVVAARLYCRNIVVFQYDETDTVSSGLVALTIENEAPSCKFNENETTLLQHPNHHKLKHDAVKNRRSRKIKEEEEKTRRRTEALHSAKSLVSSSSPDILLSYHENQHYNSVRSRDSFHRNTTILNNKGEYSQQLSPLRPIHSGDAEERGIHTMNSAHDDDDDSTTDTASSGEDDQFETNHVQSIFHCPVTGAEGEGEEEGSIEESIEVQIQRLPPITCDKETQQDPLDERRS